MKKDPLSTRGLDPAERVVTSRFAYEPSNSAIGPFLIVTKGDQTAIRIVFTKTASRIAIDG